MTDYIALMRKENKSDFSVDFPDFPGCVTAGKTLEEARKMAQEALEGHIEVMLEYGEPIPEPSTAEKIMSDPENKDAVAFIVTVHAKKPKAVRINITFPEDILQKVDQYVKDKPRLNRSKFLAELAEKSLGGRATSVVRVARKGAGRTKAVIANNSQTKRQTGKKKSKARVS
jgi:predicted RNase H-like HicB family nuclease